MARHCGVFTNAVQDRILARPVQDRIAPEEQRGEFRRATLRNLFRAMPPNGYRAACDFPVRRLTMMIAASAAAKPGTIS